MFYSSLLYCITRASRWHRTHSAQKDNPAEHLGVSPESWHVRIQSTQRSPTRERMPQSGPVSSLRATALPQRWTRQGNWTRRRQMACWNRLWPPPSQRWDPAMRKRKVQLCPPVRALLPPDPESLLLRVRWRHQEARPTGRTRLSLWVVFSHEGKIQERNPDSTPTPPLTVLTPAGAEWGVCLMANSSLSAFRKWNCVIGSCTPTHLAVRI